ncbi:MAG: NADH-quinone oxidoreductase subunit B family protein [Acidimicrobiales bacterium]
MPWIPRGVRNGIVTTRYPRRPDGYGPGFRGSVAVARDVAGDVNLEQATQACPTGAITVLGDRPDLDRGRCILCGRCTELYPEVFRFQSDFETSVIGRRALVVPPDNEDRESLERARQELGGRVKSLRRSVHIRHVDAGSDGSEEWEIAALLSPIYDVQRLGVFFTASPKHADLLLVTGAGSAGMLGPLRETYDVMPVPKVVIAVGADAISGGLIGEGYATRGGIGRTLPVDVHVPGSPPSPFSILHGILVAVGFLPPADGGRSGRDAPDAGRTGNGPVIPKVRHHEAAP